MNRIIKCIFALAILFFSDQKAYDQGTITDIEKEEQAISQKAFDLQQRGEAGKAGLTPDQLAQELTKTIETAREKQQNNAPIERYWQTEGSQVSQDIRQQQDDFIQKHGTSNLLF